MNYGPFTGYLFWGSHWERVLWVPGIALCEVVICSFFMCSLNNLLNISLGSLEEPSCCVINTFFKINTLKHNSFSLKQFYFTQFCQMFQS